MCRWTSLASCFAPLTFAWSCCFHPLVTLFDLIVAVLLLDFKLFRCVQHIEERLHDPFCSTSQVLQLSTGFDWHFSIHFNSLRVGPGWRLTVRQGYNTLINSCAVARSWELALSIFWELEGRGIAPVAWLEHPSSIFQYLWTCFTCSMPEPASVPILPPLGTFGASCRLVRMP